MEVKIKKLVPYAIIPTYAKEGDAAMDVTAISINITEDYVEYDTGLAFEVPENYVMLIFPRSSNSKQDLVLANSVGVLDSGYRGSLKLRYKRQYRVRNINNDGITLLQTTNVAFGRNIESYIFDANKIYEVGDKVGQIMIIPRPKINFKEVDELTETERGDGGFGSTGK